MKIFIRILSLVLLGATLRSMFQIAYLGASKEHDGLSPSNEVTFYIIASVVFAALFIWNALLILRPELPKRNAQVVALSVVGISAVAYMLWIH